MNTDTITELKEEIKKLTERVAHLEKELEDHKNEGPANVHNIGLKLSF